MREIFRFAGHLSAILGIVLCMIYGGAWFKTTDDQKRIWQGGLHAIAYGAYLVAASKKSAK